MKIISISPREPKGRDVTLGTTTYEFRPDADGANSCEVTDPDHIERLLSIPEGYTSPDAKPAPKAKAKKEGPVDPVLGGSENVDGEDVDGDGEPDAAPMTREEMVAAYIKKFGKAPHPNMSDKTLAERLAED